MTEVVDGRGSTSIDPSSRRKFLRRVREQVREAVDRKVRDGNVTDLDKGDTEVRIRRDRLREPSFHHGKGGIRDWVHPGNKEYVTGDRIEKPKGGQGGGAAKGEASDSGEGEDDFIFYLSPDEVRDILFADLELPNMRRLNVVQSSETKPVRAGFSTSGSQNRMDRRQSVRRKLGRVWATTATYNREIVEALKQQRDILAPYDPSFVPKVYPKSKFVPLRMECEGLEQQVTQLRERVWDKLNPAEQERIEELDDTIAGREKRRALVPAWNEATDLRYRNYPHVPVPQNRAVMFCVLDVSGSMDEERKGNAKRFFFLLYHFLMKEYEGRVEIRFIRHHTQAEEVDEKKFFYDRETGGTVVSSALTLTSDLMDKDYKGKNVDLYMAQASDGDNWNGDTAKCDPIMRGILKKVRAAFYAEVTDGPPQELWELYQKLEKQHKGVFRTGRIQKRGDIVPIFRDFLKKRYSLEDKRTSRLGASALQPALD
jgi:uncharacterized protein